MIISEVRIEMLMVREKEIFLMRKSKCLKILHQSGKMVKMFNGGMLFLVFFLLIGCNEEPLRDFPVYRFIDHLEETNIISTPFQKESDSEERELLYPINSYPLQDAGAGSNPYELKRKIHLGASEMNILFAPPESEYSFFLNFPQGVLEFGIAIKRDRNFERLVELRKSEAKGVEFLISLEMKGREKTIFQDYVELPPLKEDSTLTFSYHRIRLHELRKNACLKFTTRGGEGIFAFWLNPVLYGKAKKPKQVILVSIDTLRADHLGCYGYRRETSPAIDSLARDSAVFLNTYATTSWTLPSHVSLLTSLFDFNHQVSGEEERMHPSILTLADILRLNNFFCSAFTGGGFISALYGFSKGFDFYSEAEGDISLENSAEMVYRAIDDWLGRNADKNFFLFIHTYQPHSPYLCPEPYRKMFLNKDYLFDSVDVLRYLGGNSYIYRKLSDRERENLVALYDGEIRYTDEQLIRPLIEKLKKKGIYEQVLIIVTSDHGEEFFDHGTWEHRHNLYDETLKVPLIIKFPNSSFKGKRIHPVVRLVDVMPTILDVFHIEHSHLELDGRSLLPFLRGKEKEDRTFLADLAGNLLDSHIPEKKVINSSKNKLILNRPMSPEDLAFFISPPPATPFIELYDLESDPREKKNLAQEKSRFVREMMSEVEELYKRAGKGKRTPVKIDERLRERLKALGYIDKE